MTTLLYDYYLAARKEAEKNLTGEDLEKCLQSLDNYMKDFRGRVGARKNEKALTHKQEKFVAEYTRNGGNAKQAAMKAYPNQTEASAAQQGWENLQKPKLAAAIRKEFARQGVTLDKAIRPIVKGLEAKDKDGNDDLQKQMMAHDRWLKASMLDREDGLQLNIENAKGIEITFKNFRKEDD